MKNALIRLIWSRARNKISKGKTGAVVGMVASALGLLSSWAERYGVIVPQELQLSLAEAIVTFAISLGVFGVRDAQDAQDGVA